jgi:hypothetical protein
VQRTQGIAGDLGGMLWLLRAAASKGQQNKYFKLKKIGFLCSTKFQLFSQIKGNTVIIVTL